MNLNQQETINKLKELEIKLGRRPVKRDNSSLYSLSRKYFGTWNKMLSKADYICRDFQKPIIPEEMSGELGYFLGLVSTDGHIQVVKKSGNYRLMIYTSEKEEVDLIVKLILRLFNYKASVKLRKTGFKNSRLNYEIYISSKNVVMFVNSLGIPIGAKSTIIEFPKIFINERKYLWDYIRGVFDGDGSIIHSGNNHVFKISSGSIKFLEGLHKIFINEGFNKFMINKDNRGNVWDLRNNTKSDLNRLYIEIYKDPKFYYPRKKLKWKGHHI